jgi:hypothetical protein
VSTERVSLFPVLGMRVPCGVPRLGIISLTTAEEILSKTVQWERKKSLLNIWSQRHEFEAITYDQIRSVLGNASQT